MRRGAVLLFALVIVLTVQAAPESKSKLTAKEALFPFNELVGGWKGVATPTDRTKFWNETMRWSWKFKGDDAWIIVDFVGGKMFRNGTVRWLPDKSKFQLTLNAKVEGKDDVPMVFEGEYNEEKRVLVFERTDPDKKELQRFIITFPFADGIRIKYLYEAKPANRTLFAKVYDYGATKEGESLAGPGEKKPLCVVSLGVGTSTVMYMGKTYYVCCSGCRDYFLENPEKCIKEFEAKLAKEKLK